MSARTAVLPPPLLAALGDAGALDRHARCVEAGINPHDCAKATRLMSALELRTLINCGRYLVAQWVGFKAETIDQAMDLAAWFFVGEHWRERDRPHPVVARGLRLFAYANNCPRSLSLVWWSRYGWEVDPDPVRAEDWVPCGVRQRRLEECGSNLIEAEIVAGVRGVDGVLLPHFRAGANVAGAKAGVA